MRIIVCVKLVNKELSPFDACALECALRFKDSDPDTDLTIMYMGRPDCLPTLQALTRLGVSRAVLLSDNIFAGADTLATAYTLSLAIKNLCRISSYVGGRVLMATRHKPGLRWQLCWKSR